MILGVSRDVNIASRMSHRVHARYTRHNRARVVQGGGAYFDRMEALIDAAQRIVHLQVYIFGNDATGERIGAALVRAAQRGVKVFLIADGFASRGISPELVKALRDAGGHFRWFEPLFRSRRFYIGRRMHHKVLVVDHRHGLVSGRNIADRYNDIDGQPAWFDMALEVEGEVALDLARLCCTVWNGTLRRSRRYHASPPSDEERAAVLRDRPEDEHCAIRVRYNDWLLGRSQVAASYLEMFREARTEVLLMASYFVPGRALKRALAQALRRGVRITVITTGPSDVWLSKPAERWLYAWLLRKGAAVHEYQKSIMHAKVATRDGAWSTLGSFNLNDLSVFTTLEVNLDVDDARIVGDLHAELKRIAHEDCKQITEADQRRTRAISRLGQWSAYQALRLTNGLLTFYYRREH